MTQTTTAPEAGSEPLANDRHEAFCIEYLKDMNATQAYIRAGYKPGKAATVGACQLIAKPNVAARVDYLRRSKFKALHMGADETLAEIARLARFNIKSITHITPRGEPYIDLSMATEDDMAAIGELVIEDYMDGRGDDAREVRRVKAKAPHKMAALALLAKHHGMLTEKIEVTVTDGLMGKMAQARERLRRAREKKDD